MNRALVAALVAPLLAGCHARARAVPALMPLGPEAELHVYLQPLPSDAARLAFSITSIAAIRQDGSEVPLELALAEVSGGAASRQRLLASGRLPPDSYSGLALRIGRATLAGEGKPADLLVPEEPVRIDLPLQLARGRAAVASVALREGQVQESDYDFAGNLTGHVLEPASTVLERAGYVSRPGLASLAVIDRRSHEVTAVIPTGREPTGLAVDALARRAYVALGGEDQVQMIDLATGEELGRIPLRSGDEPADLALTPDGLIVLVAAKGSNSVAILDAEAGLVLERLPTGVEPWVLRLDRDGRRAYVLDRRSGDITVVDVPGRAVVRTVTTEPEPLAAQLNRAGTRLYVIHRGSAYLSVFSVPDLTVVNRLFVGLGAGALEVDPRTDLVYVGRADERRIQVFDPFSFAPLGAIELPGPVSYLTVDAVENTLLALMPTSGAVAFIDLASRRVVSVVDVGADPLRLVVVGERR